MDITKFAILKKLAGGGGTSTAVEIDNKTIVKGSDGKLKTAVGGYETVDFDITWDGDTTGKTFVELGPIKFYHVSDEFLTKEQLIGATVEITQGSEKVSMTIAEGDVNELNGAVVAQESIISVTAPTTTEGITFEKKGVYFLAGNNIFISRLFAVTVEKIPAKFIDQTLLEQKVDDVRTAAETAQTTAETAQTTAMNFAKMVYATVSFTFDKQTTDRDTFVFNSFDYYKISDFHPDSADVISFNGTRANGDVYNIITTGTNCVGYGLFIVVNSPGSCSLPVTSSVTMNFTAPSSGLYAKYTEGNEINTAGTANFEMKNQTGIVLYSSTINSGKKFKISVDDSGTLSATEVT